MKITSWTGCHMIGLAGLLCCALPLKQARAGTYTEVYDFGRSTSDGTSPVSLTVHLGNLYGITASGGGSAVCSGGCGTVFKLTPDGTESVLYAFNDSDHTSPSSGLLPHDGKLYGIFTGNSTRGIFSLDASGVLSTVYVFPASASDGSSPVGNLLNDRGKIIGTTLEGGGRPCAIDSAGCGTVFTLSTSGAEKVLHRFGGKTDGTLPDGGLVDLEGTYYGVTLHGGASNVGALYSITPAGKEVVLHSFDSNTGAYYPNVGLTPIAHRLYGASTYCAHSYGCIYSVDEDGHENDLHDFTAGSDGEYPNTTLLHAHGVLYGATATTLFSISPTGTFTVLHTFDAASAGRDNGFVFNLVKFNGAIYGVTYGGGVYRGGTIYKYVP